MGTVPACEIAIWGLSPLVKWGLSPAQRALRSCAAAEERDPPHFVRPRPPPPSYKSSIVTFRIVISSPPSLSAHLRLIYSSSTAHLQLIYLSLLCGNI